MEQVNFLKPGISIDLSNCEKEPIHTPGAIQPHGYIICFDKNNICIHISQNLLTATQTHADEVVGIKLENLPKSIDFIKTVFHQIQGEKYLNGIVINNKYYAVHNTPSNQNYTIFSFSPEGEQLNLTRHQNFQLCLQDISYNTNEYEAANILANAIQILTEYDRVMIYRFDKNWNGEVIAEKKLEHLDSFLGLHYPASDIPPQARALYTLNLVRLICDVNYTPDPLNSAKNLPPIDLSYSSLRSISPMHIQYLKNMGVQATFVISLMVDEKLWGLISCHHYSGPKYISIIQQRICLSASVLASLAIGANKHVELNNTNLNYSEKIKKLNLLSFFEETEIQNQECDNLFLSLTNSTGASFVSNSNLVQIGQCPEKKVIHKIIDWYEKNYSNQDIFYTNTLASYIPNEESLYSSASGIIIIPIFKKLPYSTFKKYILLFRPEIITTVKWGGNPEKAAEIIDNILCPRRSFELWKENKKLTALDWTENDIEIAKLMQLDTLKEIAFNFSTKLKDMELKLAQGDRLSIIGQLSAQIAHDFNNILQGINSATQLNSKSSPSSFAEKIKKFTNRGTLLIQQMLNYSRIDTSEHKPVNIKELFEEIELFSRVFVKDSITIEIKSSSNLEDIYFLGSSQEIFQSIINIVSNAKDAMSMKGGVLTLSLFIRKPDNKELKKFNLDNKEYIFIGVSDTGSGISEDHIKKIFDPFFSTKAKEGKGTGLGLANVMQTIKAIGGEILVESTQNVGTSFEIILPILTDESLRKEVPIKNQNKIIENSASEKYKILYVEDDLDIQEIVLELLQEYSSEIVTAKSGLDALSKLEEQGAQYFNFILSDFRMPDMDGVSFYRHLRSTGNMTPFILATGELGYQDKSQSTIQDKHFTVVSKPFDISEVIKNYRKMIAI